MTTNSHAPKRRLNPRESGVAMVLALVLMIGLLAFTAVSVELTKTHATANRSEERIFVARQIAESALAQGLARFKEGGETAPASGNGANPVWVPYADGEFFYSSTFDMMNELAIITAWGRVPVSPNPSGSPVSPLDPMWDGDGYITQGLEITVKSSRYIPETPMYFGNGGIEKPLNGFQWGAGVDVFDPSTWQTVSSPSSYQSGWVPMVVNSLDHPVDYLLNGGSPKPPAGGKHVYPPMVSQNLVGQMNTEAWFNYSAGGGSALSGVIPATTTYYEPDPASPGYAFPIDPFVADVQDFAWNLWSRYENNPWSPKLPQGSLTGTYGNLLDPRVTFVTGTLTVASGTSFSGAGILVIRDDFDPNIDTNNTPATRAGMNVYGNFEWTGLVIVAGWAPTIHIRPGGNMTVVGALMGEDSVMSGGEISLDSATITLRVEDQMQLLYSASMFKPGGMIYDYLPQLKREVIGARELYAN